MRRNDEIGHVLWDWNGTLLDDTWLCLDIANSMLAVRGLSLLTKPRYQAIFDFPVIRYYERMGFDLKKETFERVAREFIDIYEARRHEASLHADALDTLAYFQARGISQSVLSNYPHDTLVDVLNRHGVRHFFHDVIGSDDIYARGKQERGQCWLQSQCLDPKTVVMVGDTAHDYEVARYMGTHSALLTTGSHSRERLEPLGAPVFDSLRDFAASDSFKYRV